MEFLSDLIIKQTATPSAPLELILHWAVKKDYFVQHSAPSGRLNVYNCVQAFLFNLIFIYLIQLFLKLLTRGITYHCFVQLVHLPLFFRAFSLQVLAYLSNLKVFLFGSLRLLYFVIAFAVFAQVANSFKYFVSHVCTSFSIVCLVLCAFIVINLPESSFSWLCTLGYILLLHLENIHQ